MQKIQSGYNIVSLFTSLNTRFVQKFDKSSKYPHGLLFTLIGAFFIVAISASILHLTINSLQISSAGMIDSQELAAFQPGQVVSNTMRNGYIGR